MQNEEHALVLDYLAKGKSDSYKSEPVAQVIGTTYFTLLEVVPKKELKAMEKIYVGKEERQEVDRIKRRISFKELTSTSVSELEKAVEKIVEENKQRFLDFFNNSGSITIKRHQLELLPGLGKKHLFDILEKRKEKQFDSFEDIEKRVRLMPNPVHLVTKRIVYELEGDGVKHYLFTRPPARPFQKFGRY